MSQDQKQQLTALEVVQKKIADLEKKIEANKFKKEETKAKAIEDLAKAKEKMAKMEEKSDVESDSSDIGKQKLKVEKLTKDLEKAKKKLEEMEKPDSEKSESDTDKPKKSKTDVLKEKIEAAKAKIERNKFRTPENKEKAEAELEKLVKDLEKVEPKVEAKAAKEKVERIKNISGGFKKTYENAAGTKLTASESKKLIDHINDLPEEVFGDKTIDAHIIDYVKWKMPRGAGAKPSVVGILELQNIPAKQVGADNYFEVAPKDGSTYYVAGPESNSDEDVTEIEFEGQTYHVGDDTGRVYLEIDDRDVFQGFIGVDRFKRMTK